MIIVYALVLMVWANVLQDEPDKPHASDCAYWVDEPCDCVTGQNL